MMAKNSLSARPLNLDTRAQNWVVVNNRAWRLSASGKLDACTSYPLEYWPLTSGRRDEGGSLLDFRWTERIDLVRLQ